MKIIKSLCIALSMYSKIPMPQFEWKQEDMKYSMIFFPFVGIIIGFLEYVWLLVCYRFHIGRICQVLIAVAITIVVTGGIHVDGYMDTMDALHSYQPIDKRLQILKDPHIGAFSVIMLLANYLILIAAITEINSVEAYIVFCLGFYMSRIMSGISVVTFKAAKKDGTLQTFAKNSEKKSVIFLLILQLTVCICMMLYVNKIIASIVIAVGVACFIYYNRMSQNKFGGITGDIAGFFVIICETCIAIAVAIGGLI